MFATLPLAVVFAFAVGQQETRKAQPKPTTTESAKALEEFKADAAQYVIRLDSRPKDKLTLSDESLLHWGNAVRTGEDGAVFVWLLDGRPEVIGSVFTYRLPTAIRRKHEFHSLAAGPLVAEYKGSRVWAPKTAGVTFKPLSDAPEPAGTARQRLSQMKALARDFSGRMTDYEGEQTELRLISQPLLRYEPKNQPTIDGTLFSFAVGNDPEVILLLEARRDKGETAWHYGLARYHYVELKVSYKDKEVWQVPALPKDISMIEMGEKKYQDSIYTTFHTLTTPIKPAP